MKTQENSAILTIPEAAAFLRIGVGTAYALAKEGKLPAVKIGGAVRISRAALEALIVPADASDVKDPEGEDGRTES